MSLVKEVRPHDRSIASHPLYKVGVLPEIPKGNAGGLAMIEIAEKFGAARGVTSSTAHGVSEQ